VMFDITERRRTSAALHESELRRQQVLEAMLHAEADARAQIAAELHDDTIQVLTAALLSVERVSVAADHSERVAAALSDAIATLRGAVEALSNARKHSAASRVDVRLIAADGWLLGSVADDGCGFDVARALDRRGMRLHLGLDSMQERLRLAGGDVEILLQPGAGARIEFRIPFGDPQRGKGRERAGIMPAQ